MRTGISFFKMQSIKMREELFWDREPGSVSPDIEIERAINFGGFDYIEEVQKNMEWINSKMC